MRLRDDLRAVELAMEQRQDDEENEPLWWLGMVAGTLLEFVDVLEPVFIIRDALRDAWVTARL